MRMFPYWVKIVLFTLARFCATVRAVRQIFLILINFNFDFLSMRERAVVNGVEVEWENGRKGRNVWRKGRKVG